MFAQGWRNGMTNLLHLLTILTLALSMSDLEEGSHYTNTWAVEFASHLTDNDVVSIAHANGFISYGKVFPDSNLYELHHPRVSKISLEDAESHTNLLEDHAHVKSAEQQIGKRRVKRAHIPEPPMYVRDPLWHSTWYLKRGIGSKTSYDMNVIPAWKMGYSGKNIVVTILDDGIEHNHPDLQANYDPKASRDINQNDDDPMPRYDYTNENRHGTRCAGEVAAVANNSYCSVGVAFDAKIGGIRMLDGSVTDLVESKSLSFNRDHIDIYSSSWGPDDNGRTVDGPGTRAKKAFVDGVEKGRGGKGNIFVWASGNGGSHYDSCSCDGYTNSIYTLSVSSASEHNTPPWYLEQCASTLASTYSSGANGRERQIITTDLRKLCTSSHTGTSASAPLAAGLLAVMLEANPALTWRDVQYVTLASANAEPLLAKGDFKRNGVQRQYSHKFGYGLMDCGKMVTMARDWRKVPPQLIKRLPKVSPDGNLRSVYRGKVVVAKCSNTKDWGCIRHLEHVQLVLRMSSTRRGMLTAKLTSPSGTTSTVLPTRRSDTAAAGFTEWPFLSVHFWGEDPAGTWTFEINNGGQAGKIQTYQLVLHGVSVDPFDKKRPETPDEIVCHKNCKTGAQACFGSGADQCKECKAGLHKVEDTNMCVSSCGDGYYTDTASQHCKLCYKLCKTCTGADLDACTSCPAKLLLDNEGHCVEQCPKGFFPDSAISKCLACKENCTSCSSLDDCLVCGDGFDVVHGRCKLRCIDREFRNSHGVCVPCNDKVCALCENGDSCEICDPGFNLYHKECTLECPASTYKTKHGRDVAQIECIDCHEKCATCNEGMDNNCLSCHDRYQLTAVHKCVSNTSCPLGQFRALNLGNCTPCHATCYTCHGNLGLDCTSCKNGTYLKDGSCVANCGDGFVPYVDVRDGHTSCQRCDLSCQTCNGTEANKCISCSEGATLEKGVCNPLCKQGTYLKIDLSAGVAEGTIKKGGSQCHNCSIDCLTCSGPRSADCTSCSTDKALTQAGECAASCENGYFKKGLTMEGIEEDYICKACNPQCITCDGPTSSDCLSCTPEHILFNRQCVDRLTCYSKQFYNSTANECLSCHSSCVECVGPSELECTTCGTSQALYVPPSRQTARPATTTTPLVVGQCVLCCTEGDTSSLDCCDCTNEDSPICDKPDGVQITLAPADRDFETEHKTFIVSIVMAVSGCIVLYLIIFLLLQYRSHGRCAWRTSSSSLLVDGGAIIEYSSLTNKDADLPLTDDGFRPHSKYSPRIDGIVDYGSD